jgi:hypothetical protein
LGKQSTENLNVHRDDAETHIMNLMLIGYFPKRTETRPDWLKAAGVEEICSVSTCISDGPDEWIEAWCHNELWVFDTPELAWSVVPAAARSEFELYAYKMFPAEFLQGQPQPFAIPPLKVAPMPPAFERLGFDAVSRSCGSSFECSPLSCNHMAGQVGTNRYCLVEDFDRALRLPSKFEAEKCEPGPYYIVEVWRQRPEAG